MGSIGVDSGLGKLTDVQIEQLQSAKGALKTELNRANSIVILPDRITTYEKLKENEKKWRKVLGIDNGKLGYAVAMTGATPQQKANFLTTLQRTLNLKNQNSQAHEEFVQKQIQIAKDWAKANGRRSLTPTEVAMVRKLANTAWQRQAIDRMVANDNAKGGRRFGGNIRTRSLRRGEYAKN